MLVCCVCWQPHGSTEILFRLNYLFILELYSSLGVNIDLMKVTLTFICEYIFMVYMVVSYCTMDENS